MDLTHYTLCKPNHLPQLKLKHTQHIQDICSSGGTFGCLLIRNSVHSFSRYWTSDCPRCMLWMTAWLLESHDKNSSVSNPTCSLVATALLCFQCMSQVLCFKYQSKNSKIGGLHLSEAAESFLPTWQQGIGRSGLKLWLSTCLPFVNTKTVFGSNWA